MTLPTSAALTSTRLVPPAVAEARPRRVAMLSVHTCPLAAPGGKETGGMNVVVRELSRELGRRNIQVDAFTRSQSSAVPHIPDTDLGPNVRVIHVVSGPEAPLSKADTWAHLPSFVSGVRAFAAARGTTYDLYHAHYWMSGWVAEQLAERRPAPLVQTFHTLGARKDGARSDGLIREIPERRAAERRLMGEARCVVASTAADRQDMIDLYGADPARIRVVPPGVDRGLFRPLDRTAARAHVGLRDDDRMILFVGRFDPVKGLDTLVEAVAQLVEQEPARRGTVKLHLIGGDPLDDPRQVDAEVARIKALTESRGLSDIVTFLGSQEQEVLPWFYAAAEVVVVPSHYESFGLVALEAMACGAPVIASNVGGLPSLVRDGRTGYLVTEADPAALAAKLKLILEESGLRAALGAHGAATAEAYTWSATAEQIEDVYESVLVTH